MHVADRIVTSREEAQAKRKKLFETELNCAMLTEAKSVILASQAHTKEMIYLEKAKARDISLAEANTSAPALLVLNRGM